MATDLQNLQAIRSSLLQLLAQESAYQAQYGAKPSYTLDGQDYQWSEWFEKMQAQVDKYTDMIQKEQLPFITYSRARP